jgi:anti-sigma regulatory factor (Ser/Thr protein kinase)
MSRPASHNLSGASLELKIVSDPANLAPARKTIEAFCRDHGLSDKAADDMGLSFNEAMANIIRHAYDGRHDQPVLAVATDMGDAVRLTLRDWGNGVRPEPKAADSKDPMVPGGLGLICMRQSLDEIRFDPQPDGMLATLLKRK